MMAGRKHRQDVRRSKSGRIVYKDRGEREDQILGTVIAYRKRAGIKPDQVRDQKAGSVLGRLCLLGPDGGGISPLQYEAGDRYAKLAARYARVMGFAKPFPASPAVGMVGGGTSCAPEMDPAAVASLRREYDDAFGALRDLEIQLGMKGVCAQMADVCVRDNELPRGDGAIGNLRSGLNVLARMWGMGR